jgi:Flp pilus assembly protein TadD
MSANCTRGFEILSCAGALSLVLLAGCASPSALSTESDAARGSKSEARQLYAGQPTVVHATEYPVASAAEGLARGDAAWRQGKLDLAVYLYVQSLAYDAASPAPFLKIAAIHEQLGNRALAAKAFELALARDPANPGACERLGLLHLESGQDEVAERLLHAAVLIDPQRWRSYNGLGILADRRGEFASARLHYDQAHLLVPDNASIVNNRGYSRYLAGDFTGAEADFRLALQMSPLPGTWTNLGRAQARQNRYADALESFLKEHDEAHARNLLGEVAMESGDFETAQSEFALALSASPRYFQAAQHNLDLLAKRIAQQEMPVAPVGASATAAGAMPAGAAAPATAAVGSWSPSPSYAYGSAPRKRQPGNDSKASTQAASCTGAAAMKPRCNPFAVKQPKPYRVAANRKPRS